MRDFTPGMLVGIAVSFLILMLVFKGDRAWEFAQSPVSDQCYEIYTTYSIFAKTQAMSPVDDSYCTEEK